MKKVGVMKIHKDKPALSKMGFDNVEEKQIINIPELDHVKITDVDKIKFVPGDIICEDNKHE
jgi:hypothetical protein